MRTCRLPPAKASTRQWAPSPCIDTAGPAPPCRCHAPRCRRAARNLVPPPPASSSARALAPPSASVGAVLPLPAASTLIPRWDELTLLLEDNRGFKIDVA